MRWLLLSALILASTANALQLAAHSVAVPVLHNELNLTPAQIGMVFSAATMGAALGGLLAALVATFWGAGPTLGVVFVCAGLSMLGSGLGSNFVGLLLVRSLVGFFIGGLLPLSMQSIREWFPSKLRPLAIGLLLSTGMLAAVFGFVLISGLLSRTAIGWRGLLTASSIPMLLAAGLYFVAWRSGSRSSPQGFADEPEVDFSAAAMLALGLFFSAPAYIFAGSFFLYALRDKVQMDATGILAAVPRIGGFLGALLAGIGASVLTHMGVNAAKLRSVAAMGCGILLMAGALATLVTSQPALGVLVFAAVFAYQALCVVLYSAVADRIPTNRVALVVAAGGLVSSLGAAVSNAALGNMISLGRPEFLFPVLAVPTIIAAGGVTLLAWLGARKSGNPVYVQAAAQGGGD